MYLIRTWVNGYAFVHYVKRHPWYDDWDDSSASWPTVFKERGWQLWALASDETHSYLITGAL